MDWNKFRAWAENAATNLLASAKKFKESGTLDRCAKVIAIVAFGADGEASQLERRKGIRAIAKRTNDAFDFTDMVDKVDEEIKTLERAKEAGDLDLGVAELIRKIGKVTREDALFLMEVAIGVANADGAQGEEAFSASEKAVVRKLALQFNLNPADFGL